MLNKKFEYNTLLFLHLPRRKQYRRNAYEGRTRDLQREKLTNYTNASFFIISCLKSFTKILKFKSKKCRSCYNFKTLQQVLNKQPRL